jgi:CRP/FNR family transcriptional regulator, nitrogen fixation regulation protein
MHTSARVHAMRSAHIPMPANRLRHTGMKTDSLSQSMDLMGATMAYPRNCEIFGEGEPADYLYKVISGSVRTYKITRDGRRQVGGFYMPGDIFGLEFAHEHTLSAEAISDTKVLVVKRTALNSLAGRNVSIAQQLLALTGRELRCVQDRILLLIESAQERVAGFLLEMAERTSEGNTIDLPMSRQDIADYLGLSIETISRTLSALETSAAIEISTSSRRIVLRNRAALKTSH